MYKLYSDRNKNKYFIDEGEVFKINNNVAERYLTDDFGREILTRNGTSFSSVNIKYDKNIENLGKGIIKNNKKIIIENLEILVSKKTREINKEQFSLGGCVEFAYTLKKELEKKKLNVEFEYGQITGVIKNESYDSEFDAKEDKFEEEVCHGVVIIKGTNFIIDIDGVSQFNEKDKTYSFSSKPKNVFLKNVSKEDFKKTYGGLEEHEIESSKDYLEQNRKFFEKVIEDIKKLNSIDIDIKTEKKKDSKKKILNFF